MRYNADDLIDMLSYKRPGKAITGRRSKTEEKFIKKYISRVPGIKKDPYGNYIKNVGKSNTAFACHTDTVHQSEGRQDVYFEKGFAFVDDDADCLGGDDTTGIWLCLNLIYAKVPGKYIFHRDEEAGARGSNYIVRKRPKWFNIINKIVSLDRKGYSDIIVYQRGQQTCSLKFAHALMNQLGGYEVAHGVFTDSAVYADYIPECTNLSIGYFKAHSFEEIQDVNFAMALFKRLKEINWDMLPATRNFKKSRESMDYTKGKFRPPRTGFPSYNWFNDKNYW